MHELDTLIEELEQRSPEETEFQQAVADVMRDVLPFVTERQPQYLDAGIIERLLVPDRIIHFRVTWQSGDDAINVNNGWRVQYNNAMGPYKGGLRFHPEVSTDTFKFLGFEQTFKSALTGLPMGGAKGGADFDPKGKSDADIMRFCHAMMLELHKYIGPEQDVPAGDIGVGEREIGYLLGAYQHITGKFHGVMTGKNPAFGGSCIRKEATGYGCVYFLENVLADLDEALQGKRCALSGAGNVALYTASKLVEQEARVVTLSDSKGYLLCEDGFSADQLESIRAIKEDQGGALSDFSADEVHYHEGSKPWREPCDIAIPCATQNELEESDAKSLVDGGARLVCEAANMPLTAAALEYLQQQQVTIIPGKAANAGGVAVSGLEQAQNAQRIFWDAERVNRCLKETMADIHELCIEYGKEDGRINYVKGANVGGFMRVAAAMKAYGAI